MSIEKQLEEIVEEVLRYHKFDHTLPLEVQLTDAYGKVLPIVKERFNISSQVPKVFAKVSTTNIDVKFVNEYGEEISLMDWIRGTK